MLKFTPIKPKATLSADAFRVELLAGARKTGADGVKEFEKTTKTWVGEKPTFEAQTEITTKGVTVDWMLPGGLDDKGNAKWFYLDRGTTVRYAVMSPDFEAKTTPNVVGSGPGKGRLLFVSRKHPRPGIKARNWTKIIAKTVKTSFDKNMTAAMQRGAKRAKR